MNKEEKEYRKKSCFIVRAVLFCTLAFIVLAYVTYVLTPKKDYGICSMVNLYGQPRDSIDVLAIGTSLLYSGNNTNILWSEYGISSYNLCSAEQPFWVSYYVLKEAIKRQSPKVVLLDAKACVYTDDYSSTGRTILSTYGIRGLDNRFGAMLASVEKPEDAIGYILALPQIHSNYESLTVDDLIYPPDNGGRGSDWKGYMEKDSVMEHTTPDFVYDDKKQSMNEREEEYVRKIISLCKEEGICLILVSSPHPDYKRTYAYYNYLWEIAEENDILYLNYNEADRHKGIDYATDFADWQHLNIMGSVSFSKILAEDLLEHYKLKNHRGEEGYESYDRCAKAWFEKYPDYQ